MKNDIGYFDKADLSEIKNTLENSADLTPAARIALKNHILADYPEKHLNATHLQTLHELIKQDNEEMLQFKKLNRLGIDLMVSGNETSITKSASAKTRDILGLIVGSLLFLSLIPSVSAWMKIFQDSFTIGSLVLGSLTLGIASIGLIALIKSIDRILFYRGFHIVKSPDKVLLCYRPNMPLEKLAYPVDAQLTLVNTEVHHELQLVHNHEQVDILRFKNLTPRNVLRLERMVERFNG